MKTLITPVALVALSWGNAALAQETTVVTAGGEEQITTTTTVTRKVAAVAAVQAPAPTLADPDPVYWRPTGPARNAPVTPEWTVRDLPVQVIKAYIRDYINSGSSASDSAALELAFYDDHVDYFDNGIVDREFIAKDVRAYATRWPARTFHIEYNGADDIDLRSVNKNTVRAEFVLKYSVRNDKKFIAGAVRSVLLIDYSNGGPKIVAVKSTPLYKREYPSTAL